MAMLQFRVIKRLGIGFPVAVIRQSIVSASFREVSYHPPDTSTASSYCPPFKSPSLSESLDLYHAHLRGARFWFRNFASLVVSEAAPSSSEELVISDSCVKRLLELQEDVPDAKNMMLRLAVDSGGCSGFQYHFSLDDNQNKDDRVFAKSGVKVVVDGISFSFVKGATIDYSEELIRSSFIVSSNPNAATGCGCGASFMAK